MMRQPTTYVPDEIWNDPNVHHYEYGQDTSIAVYRDGRRVEFDSRVTAERIAADIDSGGERLRSGQLHYGVTMKVRIDRSKWKGVITGWTQ